MVHGEPPGEELGMLVRRIEMTLDGAKGRGRSQVSQRGAQVLFADQMRGQVRRGVVTGTHQHAGSWMARGPATHLFDDAEPGRRWGTLNWTRWRELMWSSCPSRYSAVSSGTLCISAVKYTSSTT